MGCRARPARDGRRVQSAILVLLVVIVIVTTWIALPVGRMPVATILPAILAIFLLAAVGLSSAARIPDRVGQHLDASDRHRGVVALDHQLAGARTLFVGAILNDERKARA